MVRVSIEMPGTEPGNETGASGAHCRSHSLDGPERPLHHATLPSSAAATAS